MPGIAFVNDAVAVAAALLFVVYPLPGAHPFVAALGVAGAIAAQLAACAVLAGTLLFSAACGGARLWDAEPPRIATLTMGLSCASCVTVAVSTAVAGAGGAVLLAVGCLGMLLAACMTCVRVARSVAFLDGRARVVVLGAGAALTLPAAFGVSRLPLALAAFTPPAMCALACALSGDAWKSKRVGGQSAPRMQSFASNDARRRECDSLPHGSMPQTGAASGLSLDPIDAAVVEPTGRTAWAILLFALANSCCFSWGETLAPGKFAGALVAFLLIAVPVIAVRAPLHAAEALHKAGTVATAAGFMAFLAAQAVPSDVPALLAGLPGAGALLFLVAVATTSLGWYAGDGRGLARTVLRFCALWIAGSSAGTALGALWGAGVAGGTLASAVSIVAVSAFLAFNLFSATNTKRRSSPQVTDAMDGVFDEKRSHSASPDGVDADGARPASGPDFPIDVLARELGLAPRECQVLALLARGRNASHIADELTITRNTAKWYVKNVYAKLGVHSQQQLIDLVDAYMQRGTLSGAYVTPSR